MVDEVQEAYVNKMKNKLYSLLCEREEHGEWESFLDSILIELENFSEEQKSINYISLINKLSSLRYLRYEYFRKTIFDCINLIQKTEISNGILR